jgi:SAM-dependent methyltransferase
MFSPRRDAAFPNHGISPTTFCLPRQRPRNWTVSRYSRLAVVQNGAKARQSFDPGYGFDLTAPRTVAVQSGVWSGTSRPYPRGALALFTTTLFLSALLMFLLEPMVGKMVLPLLGGAPAVWNTCMLFFQTVLLAGYAYAHASTAWLGVRRQAVLQSAIVLAPLAVLPVAIAAPGGAPASGPIGWLLLVLTIAVGLPFFTLATTAAVLQKWFSATRHPSAHDPYFLYAASNLGSLVALLSYPVLVEPWLPLRGQSTVWAWGYALYAVLALGCAAVVWRGPAAPAVNGGPLTRPAPLSAGTRARWVLLAFAPSSLMLAVTTYLSTDVAAIPLLWIVPLALYLLTFVAAFSGASARATALANRALPVVVLPLALMMVGRLGGPLALVTPLHLFAFTAAAMVCHGELARSRPQTGHLTQFYLWIAVGGALGGLFNTLVAPLVFTGIIEYPLVLVLACLLRPGAREPGESRSRLAAASLPALVGALSAGIVLWANQGGVSARLFLAAMAVPAVVTFSQSRRARRFAASLALMLLAGQFAGDGYGARQHTERTFFGVYRVRVDASTDGGYRYILHGTTLHGLQSLDPSRRDEPLAYYHRGGPAGQAFDALPAASRGRIAVVGLGAGALAAYAAPLQRWRFYEIDPAVERLARDPRYFTYLGDCGDRCDVVLGDARLSLAAEPDGAYDLIVLDAFSSDAIPVHLVTRDALALYRAKLAEGGALLFHISNRHLALAPILARLAAVHGLVTRVRDEPAAGVRAGRGTLPSEWLVMAASEADLGPLARDSGWTTPTPGAGTPVWTDDFSNVLGALRIRR